jgi:hypothetical protein
MQEFFLLIEAALALVGLITLQLRLLKKHHPNAELIIGLLKMLDDHPKTPEDHSNG